MFGITPRRLGDFTLYIFIGIAVALSVFWYISREDRGGAELIVKWVGLTGTTLILFGYAIREHKLFASRISFWLVISLLLSLHTVIFVILLIPRPPA